MNVSSSCRSLCNELTSQGGRMTYNPSSVKATKAQALKSWMYLPLFHPQVMSWPPRTGGQFIVPQVIRILRCNHFSDYLSPDCFFFFFFFNLNLWLCLLFFLAWRILIMGVSLLSHPFVWGTCISYFLLTRPWVGRPFEFGFGFLVCYGELKGGYWICICLERYTNNVIGLFGVCWVISSGMVNIFLFFKGVGETSCYVLTVKDMTFVSDNDERCDYVVFGVLWTVWIQIFFLFSHVSDFCGWLDFRLCGFIFFVNVYVAFVLCTSSFWICWLGFFGWGAFSSDAVLDDDLSQNVRYEKDVIDSL